MEDLLILRGYSRRVSNNQLLKSAIKARLVEPGRLPRDLFVLVILVTAMALLIWNGMDFFRSMAIIGEAGLSDQASSQLTDEIKIAATTLTLNVALLLFGWRYYVDVQQEAQRRAESEARAALVASTDGMTGLLNRKGFAERGEILFDEAMRSGDRIAVISLQLNKFKSVNDRHGFDIGDEVLRKIADGLDKTRTDHQALARINGDEFALIVPVSGGKREQVERIAQAMLEVATRPWMIEDRMINCGAFVGIAMGDPAQLRARDILRRADIAQAQGRTGRVARPVWFDEGMERELLAHSEIEQGIRTGIQNQQFIPYFEPQVDLATGRITGFEMLARWEHPLSGLVSPDRFIPIAEEHNLIGELSEQVIRQALLAAQRWPDDLNISVNISPRQLADSWLAQKLVRILTETGFPAERLTVEITESSLFADLELAQAIVASLKNQGIKLALDDFGTGFSSLAHLRALPFDSIKIDRSFTASLPEKAEAEAIIRAVTTLGKAIDIPVTVEGIETERTHAAVLGLGCTTGQGWYFGKPMSVDQAEHLLRRGNHQDMTGGGQSANFG